jgi:hypothetical protein
LSLQSLIVPSLFIKPSFGQLLVKAQVLNSLKATSGQCGGKYTLNRTVQHDVAGASEVSGV